MTHIPRPLVSEYPAYFGDYLRHVPHGDVLAMLERQAAETIALVAGLGEQGARHRYADGKWSVKEIIGHLTDTERLFVYRANAFARGDAGPLPGMDENAWAAASNADDLPLDDLVSEFAVVRWGSVNFFGNLDDAALARRGVASGMTYSVRCVPWLIAGHELHHVKVVKERYL